MSDACLRLDDFSKFYNNEYRSFMFRPFNGEVANIVKVSESSCNVVLKGGDRKRVIFTCRMSANEFTKAHNLKRYDTVTISDYGFRSISEWGDLMLSMEAATTIEKNSREKADLSEIYHLEHNPTLCCASLVFDRMDYSKQSGTLNLVCVDSARNCITFKAYNGAAQCASRFHDVFKNAEFAQGHVVKITNFTILPIEDGKIEFRLTEESAIGLLGHAVKRKFHI